MARSDTHSREALDRWRPAVAIKASAGVHGLAALGLVATPASWPWIAGALLANHLVLGVAGMCPRSRLLGPNLARLPLASAQRGEVALTFDDGPHPTITPAVLDLLDRYQARASFFVIGKHAAAHPDLVRDMRRRGHSVENHSQHHSPFFACCGPGALMRDLRQTQEIIGSITGRAPRFFRPPMGLRNPLLYPVLAKLGLLHVSWTRRGYDSVSRDAAAILRRLESSLGAGDILLMHDFRNARTQGAPDMVLKILASLLARIHSLGLRSVTLPMALDQ